MDTDQLKKNIVAAQEKAIEEYNDYSEQKAIESAKTNCTTWYYYHGNTEEEIPFEYYKSVECTVSYSYKYYTYNKTETEITNLKLVNSGTITKEYDKSKLLKQYFRNGDPHSPIMKFRDISL